METLTPRALHSCWEWWDHEAPPLELHLACGSTQRVWTRWEGEDETMHNICIGLVVFDCVFIKKEEKKSGGCEWKPVCLQDQQHLGLKSCCDNKNNSQWEFTPTPFSLFFFLVNFEGIFSLHCHLLINTLTSRKASNFPQCTPVFLLLCVCVCEAMRFSVSSEPSILFPFSSYRAAGTFSTLEQQTLQMKHA